MEEYRPTKTDIASYVVMLIVAVTLVLIAPWSGTGSNSCGRVDPACDASVMWGKEYEERVPEN